MKPVFEDASMRPGNRSPIHGHEPVWWMSGRYGLMGRLSYYFLLITSVWATGCSTLAKPQSGAISNGAPVVRLVNGALQAEVFLPDAKDARYRGQRFDGSGMIGRLTRGDQIFWDQWSDISDPLSHDKNATGPSMEFDMDTPPGYAAAAVGGGFVKIGVGVLMRSTDGPYAFSKPYKVLDPGTRSISWSSRSITFQHRIAFENFSYDYLKCVSLIDDRTLSIACVLTNAGRKPIHTDVYVHNFLRPGGQGWRPGIAVSFNQPVALDLLAQTHNALDQAGNSILITHYIPKGQSVWAPLIFPIAEAPNTFSVDDGVRRCTVHCDFSPSRVVVFGLAETVCIEPFLRIDLAPGTTKRWSYRYKFDS